MTPDVQPPIIDRYGYTWVQHPDGPYYGPHMANTSFTSVGN
jgi:hypothetical protein